MLPVGGLSPDGLAVAGIGPPPTGGGGAPAHGYARLVPPS
jgi:hypothetical protein